MATVNKLTAIYASHSIYLERLAVGLGNKAKPFIYSVNTRVAELLDNIPSNLTPKRQDKLQAQIAAITKEELKAYVAELKKEHRELGAYEAGYTNKSTKAVIDSDIVTTVPAMAQIAQAAKATPITLGENSFTTYGKMMGDYWRTNADKLDSIVLSGFVNGQTNKQKADLIKTAMNDWSAKAERNAQTIARTGANHYATQARLEFASDNNEVITGFRSIAVLDNRTSSICRSLDNVVMKRTDSRWGKFVTPRHPNCRSMLVTEINAKYTYDDSSAERPSNFTVDDKKDPKRINSKKTYYEELGKLKASDQDEILGKKLGKAFRKMNDPDQFARDMVNQATLEPYTMAQLRKKDSRLGEILQRQQTDI